MEFRERAASPRHATMLPPSRSADSEGVFRSDLTSKQVLREVQASVSVLVEGQQRVEGLLNKIARSTLRQSSADISTLEGTPPGTKERAAFREEGKAGSSDNAGAGSGDVWQTSRTLSKAATLTTSATVVSQPGSGGPIHHLVVRPEMEGTWEELKAISVHVLAIRHEVDDGMATHSLSGMAYGTDSGHCASGKPKRHLWVMTPSSWWRLGWDLISILVLGYDMMSLPYILAFNIVQEGWLEVMSYVGLMFWILDIVVTFRTGTWVHGELKMLPRDIARNYMSRTFFFDTTLVLVDALALFLTFSQASSQAGATDTLRIGRMVKITRLMRCMNVLRVRRVADALDRLSRGSMFLHATTTVFFDVVKITSVILWLNHLIACIWCSLGQGWFVDFDTGISWLDTPTGDEKYATFGSAGNTYQYTTALHWALTQMTPGSMQVFPVNSAERIFNMVCLVFGLLGFSTLISSISSTVTQFKIKMTSHTAKLDAMQNFLRTSNISSALAMQVRKQVTDKLRARRLLVFSDVEVLNSLSLSLQSALMMDLCSPHLRRHDYFLFLLESDVQNIWAEELCRTCTSFKALTKKDTLFLTGARAEGVYFPTRGELTYTPEARSFRLTHNMDGKPQLAAGVQVEPGKWLSEAALWVRWKHVGTAEAAKHSDACEVLIVMVEPFMQFLKRQSGMLQQLSWAYAQNFSQLLSGVEPGSQPENAPVHSFTLKQRDAINDLKVNFTTDEVLAAMPKHTRMAISYNSVRVLKGRSRKGWMQKLTGLGDEEVSELEKEVQASQSTLLLTSSRPGIYRVVMEVVLRLSRSADDRLLVFLSSERQADGTMKAACSLPTIVRDGTESPHVALRRLVDDRLSTLAVGVKKVSRVKKQVSWQTCPRTGIPTRHLRSICSVIWNDEPDAEDEDSLDASGAEEGPPKQEQQTPPPQVEVSDAAVSAVVQSANSGHSRQPTYDRIDRHDSYPYDDYASAGSPRSGAPFFVRRFTKQLSILSRSSAGTIGEQMRRANSMGSETNNRTPGSEAKSLSESLSTFYARALSFVPQVQSSPAEANAPRAEVFTLPDGTYAAWMARDDFNQFNLSSNQRALQKWVQGVANGSEEVVPAPEPRRSTNHQGQSHQRGQATDLPISPRSVASL